MADDRDEPESREDELPSPAPTLPYASPSQPVKFKTLRTFSAFEANLAAAKLETAGIDCFVAGENISAAHPLAFANVRLQVPEHDFERAEEILATPTPIADGPGEGEEDVDPSEMGTKDTGYVRETYRCPQCHGKAIDLAPLSPAMKQVRFGCLTLLVIPFVLGLVVWLVPMGDVHPSAQLFPDSLQVAWLVVIVLLTFIVLTAKRDKQCRACGHKWGETPTE